MFGVIVKDDEKGELFYEKAVSVVNLHEN